MQGEKKTKQKKQQSHPRDGAYGAVTAALRLQLIRGLYQDKQPCGTPVTPSQKLHFNNSIQMYTGCPNGYQDCSHCRERRLSTHKIDEHLFSFTSAKKGCHYRNWQSLKCTGKLWTRQKSVSF